MASHGPQENKVLGKIPVIGPYRRDKIQRAAENQIFAADAPDGYVDPEPTTGEWIRAILPGWPGVINYVAETFPCSKWLFSYNLTWLIGDLIAG
jgi:hypothetical protein